jgi:phosphate:Na+ symporter
LFGIIFGSNLGTTTGAWLVAGKRLAVAHLIFNLVTGTIAILFIKRFALAVDRTSDLVGIAADNFTLKFAVFHTLFNLVGVVSMLPAINLLVRLLERTRTSRAPCLSTTPPWSFPIPHCR